MAWIFQGNPKIFDINDYLARYPELIYWRAPRHQAEIKKGDRAYIWRAGIASGLVASGEIVEAATAEAKVLHPEALGDDLWIADNPEKDAPKVGISLDAVRLSIEEGMVSRRTFKDDPSLRHSTIITMAAQTVFYLDENQSNRVEKLWGVSEQITVGIEDVSDVEAAKRLRAHYRRERSRFLVTRKRETFQQMHGKLFCELCKLSEVDTYPVNFANRIFEVHHLSPLSIATSPVRTTLSDLAVVCANCHRAIHSSKNADENFELLQNHFSGIQHKKK
jgi:hypothetical protein